MATEFQEKLMQTVAQLGYRVTVGDVAGELGLPVEKARQELNLIASQAGGSLQVSPTGEIAYEFTNQWQNILNQKAQNAQWQEFVRSVKKTALYVGRISFGIMLILSLVIIVVALFALSTATNNDRDDRRSNGPSFNFGGMYWLWYGFDPYRYFYYGGDPELERRRKYERGEPVGFLEGVFSFLFGDGDPNADLEERRWQLVAQTIRTNQGVVTAEQLAPYLDAPYNEREDYVLPALVKFDGQPQVSEQGGLVYQFPQLQVTAQNQMRTNAPASGYLEEQPWEFSKAPGGTLALAGGLGIANLLGAGFLWLQVERLGPYFLERTGLTWIGLVAPILLVYGVLFLTVPAVRYLFLGGRNTQVSQRNGLRRDQTVFLSRPSPELRAKLVFARQFATRQIVDRDSTVYDSGKTTLEQKKDLDAEDFERRLKGGS